MNEFTKLVKPALLVLVLVVATAGTSVQSGWAQTSDGDKIVLLDDHSDTWRIDSSGDKSPDGVWQVVHPGHGYVKVTSDGVMQLRPDLGGNGRHSALVLADDINFKGLHGEMKVRLDKQTSNNQKNWDSFWAPLAYVDKTTHITLLIKSDDGGWMVSKRDHDHEGKDLHEVLAKGHKFFNEVDKGHWYDVEWWIYPHDGDLHIKVVVDGHTLIDKDDPGHWHRHGDSGSGTSSYFLKAGKTIGAYSEKSYSSWKDISVEEFTG